jgi:hypothetical protein
MRALLTIELVAELATVVAIAVGCAGEASRSPSRSAVAVSEARAGALLPSADDRVPVTVSVTVTPLAGGARRFAVAGDGYCLHRSRAGSAHPLEWEVSYRSPRDESGGWDEGLRALAMGVGRVAAGESTAVQMSLDAGDALRLLNATALARATMGGEEDQSAARVTVSRRGASARFEVNGRFADGARVRGTIDCRRASEVS